jgi:hypothetical protein
MWKKAGKPCFEVLTAICLEELKQITINEDSGGSGRDSNWPPPEYESEA